jgi:ribose transport system permease protein
MGAHGETLGGGTSVPAPGGVTQPSSPGSGSRSRGHGAVNSLLALVRVGPLLVLAILVIAMTLLEPLFLTERNIQALLVQSAVVALLGIGQLMVILTRGIDISVGSIMGLSSVIGGLSLGWSIAGGATMLAAIAATGACVGLINGLIFVKGRIPHPFIVTLAMLSLARGLALAISDGKLYTGLPPAVITLGQGFVGPIPVPALVVAGAALAAYFMTRWTQWGQWIYAVGGNPDGARQVGIPVNKVLISVYVMSGLSAGLAAIITAGRTASADPNAGNLAELEAIAAVIIGGASFFGGRGNVGNVLVGALTIGIIHNGLDLMAVSSFIQLIVIGVVILLAVQLDVIRTWLEGKLRLLGTET